MLNWSIKLFHVCGIRLELHLSFIILPIYFAFQGAQEAGLPGVFWSQVFLAAIFTCVVLHELGHSLTARSFGIRTSRILLMPIGGLAQFDSLPRDPRKEFLITLAGPMVNFGLTLLLLPFNEPIAYETITAISLPESLGEIAYLAMVFNLSMGLFNLLPVFPMDGGRILRALLAFRMPALKATFLAAKIGGILAATFAIFFFINLHLFPGAILLSILFLFIYYAGEAEFRATQQFELFHGFAVDRFVDPNIESLSPQQSLADAARQLSAMRFPRDLVITEHGKAVGILTTSRLKREAARDPGQLHRAPIADCMERSFITLQATDSLDTLLTTPQSHRQQVFPAYDYSRLVGLLDARNIDQRAYWERERQGLDSQASSYRPIAEEEPFS